MGPSLTGLSMWQCQAQWTSKGGSNCELVPCLANRGSQQCRYLQTDMLLVQKIKIQMPLERVLANVGEETNNNTESRQLEIFTSRQTLM